MTGSLSAPLHPPVGADGPAAAVAEGPPVPGQSGEGRVPDLAPPPEPADLRASARRAALDETDGVASSSWWQALAQFLWRWWAPSLSAAKLAEGDFTDMVGTSRRELWLWVAGERTWDHTAGALAGRVRRRLPPGG